MATVISPSGSFCRTSPRQQSVVRREVIGNQEPMVPSPHVLREYALLADGERGAVIGPRGDIVWMCFPGWAIPLCSRR